MLITFNAKDSKCICGKQGEFLNISFDAKYGNALCETCRDKARDELKQKTLIPISHNKRGKE